MAINITKTTNGHLKVENTSMPLGLRYIPLGGALIRPNGHNHVMMIYDGKVAFEEDIANIAAPAATSIGNATFAHSTDTWTLTSHGLVVGDRVRFSAAGTGATGYAANVDYYVVSAATGNTFQLSDTPGGAVILSAADSAGTWTLRRNSATDIATKIATLS